MNEILPALFLGSSFMPHGHCYQWTSGLVWLHVISDALIVVSYFSIPVALLIFKRRKDFSTGWMLACFATFIVACGTTHLLEIWNIWHADYWLSGGAKAITAVASICTAVLLARLMPTALAMPTPRELEREIQTRRIAEENTRAANAELEKRVAERTAQLQTANEALHRKIAEREEAEISVREERDFSEAVLNSLPGVLYLYDETGRFLRWNRNFETVTGYSGDEIAAMHPLDFFLGSEKETLRTRIAEVFTKGVSDVEAEFVSKNGTRTPFYFTGVAATVRGQRCLVGVGIDITARRQAEEAVRRLNTELEQRVTDRTAQLETANKELEAFSYSVSHDLRAPLRAVDGFSQAVIDDYGPQLPGEAQRHLQTIRRGAQRMGQLIDDLLAFSRLSRATLIKRLVNMQRLAREAVEESRPLLKERSVEIVVGELPTCQGDAALLTQVWINLVSNACKYTRKQPAAKVEIGWLDERRGGTYFVRDNGTGFDMEFAPKLFGVFQRLHRAEDFEGTGVGLAIVQRIVQRHGGEVWAEAVSGQGATFYFTLEKDLPS